MKTCFFLLCFYFLLPVNLRAQNSTITGLVRSAEDGETLPGANIFLDGTTVGTETDASGRFTLKHIPNGTYTVVISYVGFQSFTTKFTFPNPQRSNIDILLQPKAMNLGELTVKGDAPEEWRRKLEQFKKYFIGYSNNADQTKILNPEVLNFKTEENKFIAVSREPLQIQNNALGYNITFHLNKFVLDGETLTTNGYSEFSLINAEDSTHIKEWNAQRKRAYEGSFRHFIAALTAGDLKDEGFRVQFSNDLRFTSDIQKRTSVSASSRYIKYPNRLFLFRGIRQITFSFHKKFNYLRVDYIKETPEREIAQRAGYNPNYHQVSFIELPHGKALIDTRTGSDIPPYRAILYAYWGWSSRIPDLLPKGYSPYAANFN